MSLLIKMSKDYANTCLGFIKQQVEYSEKHQGEDTPYSQLLTYTMPALKDLFPTVLITSTDVLLTQYSQMLIDLAHLLENQRLLIDRSYLSPCSKNDERCMCKTECWWEYTPSTTPTTCHCGEVQCQWIIEGLGKKEYREAFDLQFGEEDDRRYKGRSELERPIGYMVHADAATSQGLAIVSRLRNIWQAG